MFKVIEVLTLFILAVPPSESNSKLKGIILCGVHELNNSYDQMCIYRIDDFLSQGSGTAYKR